MQDFQTILKSKRAYYGNTEAAIEFAAREYSDQFVQQDVAQSLTLLVDNLNEAIRYLNIIALQTKTASPTAEPPPAPPQPPKPVVLEKCDVHEKGTLQWVFSTFPDGDAGIIVSEDYSPVITQLRGYTYIKFTRK